MIIPRKLQMKQIKGQQQSQMQLREEQAMFSFQLEIELLNLRVKSPRKNTKESMWRWKIYSTKSQVVKGENFWKSYGKKNMNMRYNQEKDG